MRIHQIAVGSIVSAVLAAAAIAGCSGAGGGYSAGGPPPPVPTPTPTPPTLTLGNMNLATGGTVAGGNFTYVPAANDTIIFTCGCSNQAGITTSDGTGSFTVASPASPTPAAPNPTYTIVPSRNYIIVAQPPASNGGPQGWTMLFAGTVPSHDLALGDGGAVAASAGTSDVYTTAVSLLIYKQSTQNSNTAFDDWNFNSIETWLQRMVTTPTTQEAALLDDIAAQSAINASLFPTVPGWNAAQTLNPTINQDLHQVIINPGTATPTPCPGGQVGCTFTPTP